ncbi:hypothetical protein M0813_00897 [Anaeramoeba flamelloides]|uniref:Uncharacterized protein n=1 Tax=Anaeramoeba flamelloides TaxID=1746091 RepID=A0ABQ8XHB3_9EUKA|nr:hypothetical protein M0813_00897 [Anaeramoeba flamelloides]
MNLSDSETIEEIQNAIKENNQCINDLHTIQTLLLKCKKKMENNCILFQVKEKKNQKDQKEIENLKKKVMKLQQELKSLKTQKAKEDKKKLIQMKKKNKKNKIPKNQKSTNLTVQRQTQDEITKKRIRKMIYIFQTNLNFGEKVPTYEHWKERISKKHFILKILFNRSLLGLSVQEMGKISYTIDQKCQGYANNKENKKKVFTIQVN